MSSTAAADTNRKATNATARLSAVLNRLEADNRQLPVADVLAATFGIKDPDPNRNFLLAYTAITRMLERSQREVETYLASNLAFWGSNFPPLRSCFNPKNSAQQWSEYKRNLNVANVTGIKFTAEHLKDIVPEREAKASDLEDVRSAIDKMSRALDDEPLSAHTRETLTECLNEIKRAVDEYNIWGADGIEDAFKKFAGTLMIDREVRADLGVDSEEKGGLWKHVVEFGGTVLLFLGIAHGIHDLKRDWLPTLEKLILPQPTISAPTIEAAPTISSPPDGVSGRSKSVRT